MDRERTLQAIVDEVDQGGVSSLPAQYYVLVDEFSSVRSTNQSIAAAIEDEPAVTSRLVRLANSPRYGGSQSPIESVSQAIARVGWTETGRIIHEAFVAPLLVDSDHLTGYWNKWRVIQRAVEYAVGEYGNEDDARLASMVTLLSRLPYIVLYQTFRPIVETVHRGYERGDSECRAYSDIHLPEWREPPFMKSAEELGGKGHPSMGQVTLSAKLKQLLNIDESDVARELVSRGRLPEKYGIDKGDRLLVYAMRPQSVGSDEDIPARTLPMISLVHIAYAELDFAHPEIQNANFNPDQNAFRAALVQSLLGNDPGKYIDIKARLVEYEQDMRSPQRQVA